MQYVVGCAFLLHVPWRDNKFNQNMEFDILGIFICVTAKYISFCQDNNTYTFDDFLNVYQKEHFAWIEKKYKKLNWKKIQ